MLQNDVILFAYLGLKLDNAPNSAPLPSRWTWRSGGAKAGGRQPEEGKSSMIMLAHGLAPPLLMWGDALCSSQGKLSVEAAERDGLVPSRGAVLARLL